ncbi:MAG: VOC family protein [Kiritimatiellaeota bacterium]|nr:VOC family protein [Kiritimatiellota bacterium]
MTTVHVGLVCSSEESADRFYRDLLELKKAEPKILPQPLSSAIFGLDADLKIINYTGAAAHFEIFISSRAARQERPIEHVCLEVPDVASLLERGRAMNAMTLRVPKGETFLSFLYDFDGNLFELKQEPAA